jgi:capsular exopolysaccharide synthesis family protein
MSDSAHTTLSDYLRVLRRSKWLVLLVTLLCIGVAVTYTVLKTPKYEATAQLTVRDPAQDVRVLGTPSGPTQLPSQLASAHAPDVTRPAVLREVKQQLELDESLDEVRNLITVTVDPNAFTVGIVAQASSAEDAARIANAFADADTRLTTEEAREGYAVAAARLASRLNVQGDGDPTEAAINATRISGLQGLATNARPVEVSSQAQVPGGAVSPKPVRDIGAATVIGLLLGLGIAYARSLLDRRLRNPAEVEALFEQPVLTRLRADAFGHTGSQADASHEIGPLDPVEAEAIRMLRENVRYLSVDKDLRRIAITSAVPEEGKSTVAACLAMAYASAGRRTLLVEGDLRRRVLAGRFGIAEAPGLADYLVGRAEPQDILQMIPAPAAGGNGGEAPALTCITAGSAPPRPADLLSSARFADFVTKVGKVYDQVIIDCPPLLAVADTLEVVPHVDAVLMCVRLNRTTLDQADAAREALERLPARPVGLVVTDLRERDLGYDRGYYYYGADAVTQRQEPKAPKRVTTGGGF